MGHGNNRSLPCKVSHEPSGKKDQMNDHMTQVWPITVSFPVVNNVWSKEQLCDPSRTNWSPSLGLLMRETSVLTLLGCQGDGALSMERVCSQDKQGRKMSRDTEK